jgi:hypothetical protein
MRFPQGVRQCAAKVMGLFLFFKKKNLGDAANSAPVAVQRGGPGGNSSWVSFQEKEKPAPCKIGNARNASQLRCLSLGLRSSVAWSGELITTYVSLPITLCIFFERLICSLCPLVHGQLENRSARLIVARCRSRCYIPSPNGRGLY